MTLMLTAAVGTQVFAEDMGTTSGTGTRGGYGTTGTGAPGGYGTTGTTGTRDGYGTTGTTGTRDGYGTTGNTARTRATAAPSRGRNWGWIGLLGLIGLAGARGGNKTPGNNRS